MKLRFSAVPAIAALAFAALPALANDSPNYGKSTEVDQTYYVGYVQVQPCYSDNGRHAMQGYLRYRIKGGRDTGRLYTEEGNGPRDCRILSRTFKFVDDFSLFGNKTEFYYGFNYASGSGPSSIGDSPISEEFNTKPKSEF